MKLMPILAAMFLVTAVALRADEAEEAKATADQCFHALAKDLKADRQGPELDAAWQAAIEAAQEAARQAQAKLAMIDIKARFAWDAEIAAFRRQLWAAKNNGSDSKVNQEALARSSEAARLNAWALWEQDINRNAVTAANKAVTEVLAAPTPAAALRAYKAVYVTMAERLARESVQAEQAVEQRSEHFQKLAKATALACEGN